MEVGGKTHVRRYNTRTELEVKNIYLIYNGGIESFRRQFLGSNPKRYIVAMQDL